MYLLIGVIGAQRVICHSGRADVRSDRQRIQ